MTNQNECNHVIGTGLIYVAKNYCRFTFYECTLKQLDKSMYVFDQPFCYCGYCGTKTKERMMLTREQFRELYPDVTEEWISPEEFHKTADVSNTNPFVEMVKPKEEKIKP